MYLRPQRNFGAKWYINSVDTLACLEPQDWDKLKSPRQLPTGTPYIPQHRGRKAFTSTPQCTSIHGHMASYGMGLKLQLGGALESIRQDSVSRMFVPEYMNK